MKYIVRYPHKDTPKQRWCFVVMKPPADVFREGDMRVMLWDGYKWNGSGEHLFQTWEMNDIMYWLEKEEPDECNRI